MKNDIPRYDPTPAMWGSMDTSGRIISVRTQINKPSQVIPGRRWVPLFLLAYDRSKQKELE